MRRALDRLYLGAAVLAGMCLVAIAVLVVAQIAGRLAGVFIRGLDQLSGYLLAAATFLALAHTFATGGHIRVELLLERLPPRSRRAVNLACLLLATAVIGYFAWHAVVTTWQSYEFMEVTVGLLAVPLWIPQSVMAIGLCIMFVAVADALVTALDRRAPARGVPRPGGPPR
ncbi:membrane protein [Caldovatus sediminis]|uniref:TRAP transporter small permease protein n=1 Tax=Caldovatus sediminis TaxID=2041189 RepID=A0A8J3EAK6_9PROT|nr:TRAP transporter small permease [Caldovatus sediminis]GGG28146.1 membrane protein [Caldovatus sediminis]